MHKANRKLETIRLTGLKLDSVNAFFGSITRAVMMAFNLIALIAAALMRHWHIMEAGIGDVVLLSGYFAEISGSVMAILYNDPAYRKIRHPVSDGFMTVNRPSNVFFELTDGKRQRRVPSEWRRADDRSLRLQ